MNDHNGNASLSELLRKLALAEQEDVAEEDDPLWIRPLVRKKKAVKKRLSIAHVFTDEFHDPGHDFSSNRLRGLGPGKFGWSDWGIPPENEKEGFIFMQKALEDHYTWFRNANPAGFWLRS